MTNRELGAPDQTSGCNFSALLEHHQLKHNVTAQIAIRHMLSHRA